MLVLSFSNCRAAILLNIAAKLHPRNGNNVRGKELRIKVEDEFLDNFLGVWCITPMMSKDSEGILSKSVQIFIKGKMPNVDFGELKHIPKKL